MSLKITAKGEVGQLMALFNLLSESDQVKSVKSNPLYRNKDMQTGSQTLEATLIPAKEFKRTYKPRDKSGYVYLLETSEAGVYKIGCSSDPRNRKQTFKVNLPFEVNYLHVFYSDDMYRDERDLKLAFWKQGKQLQRSEFFRLSEDDVLYIRSL